MAKLVTPNVTPDPSRDLEWMGEALLLAAQAEKLGEVPVGAVVVYKGQIIAKAHNRRETDKNPLAHAEVLALQEASQVLDRWRLSGCTLYVTLEPCVMCAGALLHARVDRVVYGATDPKAGAVESLYSVLSDLRLNHRPHLQGGVLQSECSKILSDFFRQKRNASGSQTQS
jgi:tRNA(adenine34) deaminase